MNPSRHDDKKYQLQYSGEWKASRWRYSAARRARWKSTRNAVSERSAGSPGRGRRPEEDGEERRAEAEKRIERYDKPFHRVMRPRLAIGVKRSVMPAVDKLVPASAIYARPLRALRHAPFLSLSLYRFI